MASSTPTQFHGFTKLPPEIQNLIWHASVQQTPRVYELFHYHPPGSDSLTLTFYHDFEDEWETLDIKMENVTLVEESTILQRPLLQVDKVSRKENLRYYQLVQFSNAKIYMNMDIDIVYLGHMSSDSLLSSYLTDGIRFAKHCDPFWKKVKHFAWGVEQVTTDGMDLDFTDEHGHTSANLIVEDREHICFRIDQLRMFPALETFTLVLDRFRGGVITEYVYPYDPEPGAISFGNCSAEPGLFPIPEPPFQLQLMLLLEEKWESALPAESPWNVPQLKTGSLIRNGITQHPIEGGWVPKDICYDKMCAKRIEEKKLIVATQPKRRFLW